MFFSLPQLSPSLLIFCLNLLHLSLSFFSPPLFSWSTLPWPGWRGAGGGGRQRSPLSRRRGGKQLCQGRQRQRAGGGGRRPVSPSPLPEGSRQAAASGCGRRRCRGRRWWRAAVGIDGREAAEFPSASRPCPRREGGAPGPGQRRRGGTERRARPAGALKKEISFFFCYSLLRWTRVVVKKCNCELVLKNMDDFVVIVVVKWCSYELVLKNMDDFVVDFVHSIYDDLGNMQIAKKTMKEKEKKNL